MEIWQWTAVETVDAIEQGEVSANQVLDALEARIMEVDPVVNALPTRCFERARQALARGDPPGPFHGLPVPIKDSYPVNGIRTTYGSLAFEDHTATHSDYLVEAIEASGGLVYAKSNTPEFEAGANTFNEVFGRTLNPWNTALSAAGSSGGAAVAVATGMAYFGQGSDFASSVRYPASFCGLAGLRPTPGLIPQGPNAVPYQTLSVIGPLARNVADVGLALDGMARFDARDPLTRTGSPGGFRLAASRPNRPRMAAFAVDLGLAEVDGEVAGIVTRAVERLAKAGLEVAEAVPDLTACHDAFRPLRAFQFAAMHAKTLERARDKLKPEVVWNIEQGLKLTAEELAGAEAARALVRRNMVGFLQTNGFLIAATTPVKPFPVGERYVTNINGRELPTYLDWLVLGYAVTVTGCPAISIPCGFTGDGLPVGLQIIGPPCGEADLLSFAAWCEEVLGARLDRPIDPKMPTVGL